MSRDYIQLLTDALSKDPYGELMEMPLVVQHKAQILDALLALEAKEFSNLAFFNGALPRILKLFEVDEDKEKIFEKFFSDPVFLETVRCDDNFIELVIEFPNHMVELYDKLTSSLELFQRGISNTNELENLVLFINKSSKEYEPDLGSLQEQVLGSLSDDEKQQIDLDDLEKHKQFLNKFEDFIKNHAAKFTEKFYEIAIRDLRRLVNHSIDFESMVELFPNHSEDLAKEVLRDPVLFDRVIVNDAGLNNFKQYCPSVSIIQDANSFQEARNAIKTDMLQKNSRAAFAKLTALDREGFFATKERPQGPAGSRTLPPDLGNSILRDHFHKKL